MNDIVHYRAAPTIVVAGLTAALAATPAIWPDRARPNFVTTHVGASFSSFEKSLSFAPVSEISKFADQIAAVYAELSDGQEPLGAEFEDIWDANVAILYES
jgi:hypothetical protein